MSLLDGTPKELTYGEALVAMAEKISWQTEHIQREVVAAVQKEHGLVPPPPDVVSVANDPRDITLANQDREIADRKAAQLAAEKATADAQAQLAEALAKLAAVPPQA